MYKYSETIFCHSDCMYKRLDRMYERLDDVYCIIRLPFTFQLVQNQFKRNSK